MKHARSAAAALAVVTVLCGAGTVLGQSLSDYFIGPDLYPDADTVAAFAVTPNDRFIVVLRSKSLTYIDTWNFKKVAGAGGTTTLYTGDTTGTSLAISADGAYALVGNSKGKITAVHLAPLYNVIPNVGLATSLTKTTATITAGNSLTPLASIPESDGGSTVYVLAGAKDVITQNLYWAPFKNGALGVPGALFSYEAGALSAGKSLGSWIYLNPFNQPLFQVIDCHTRAIPCQAASLALPLSTTDTFKGLAFDREQDEYAVTINDTQHELWTIDTFYPASPSISSDKIPTPAANDLALLTFNPLSGLPTPTCPNCDLVFTAPAAGPAITIAELNYHTLNYGDTAYLAGTPGYAKLAASRDKDGYVYASRATAIEVVTANPWVVEAGPLLGWSPSDLSGLTIKDGLTVTDGFTIGVVVHARSPLVEARLSKKLVFRDWDSGIDSSPPAVTVGDTAGFLLFGGTNDLLNECENLLTVVVGDTYGREGRAAFTINKDTAPPAEGFSLGFGDRKVIYSFTVSNLCDLASLEVWYGATTTGITTYADLAAGAHNVDIYNSPPAGDKIESSITGLTNLTPYYVWVVTIDQSGHHTIGAPQSATPQQTYTLTDLTHEDGGVTCFGSVAGSERGSGRGMALLTIPLFIGGGLTWWKRRGEVKR